MKKKGINTNIDIEIRSPFVRNLIVLLLCMLLLFFVIYPVVVFSGDKNQLKTQTAIERTVYSTADAQGFVVRKEVLITNNTKGTVIPLVKNGSKVAVGDTVANVYSDGNAAENAARMEELQTEIDYFRSISANSGNTLQTDIELYESDVADSLYSLSDVIENNELSEIYALSREFREGLTKKQIAMGKQPDVSDILNTLTAEYESIKNSFTVLSSVVTENSGYYVSAADGYENIVDFDNVKAVDSKTCEAILSAKPENVSSDTVGKLVTDFNWYLIMNINRSVIGNISVGSYATVTFVNSSVGNLSMKVEAMNQTEGSEEVTLILSSNLMNEDIAQLRNVTVKLRVTSFTGLAVDNQALRTVNGEKGVYVKVGNIVKFKKIKAVYNDANMILSVAPEGEKGYLELYDEIILEGTELYDSKLIN